MTVIQAGPCTVTEVRTTTRDGYAAVQAVISAGGSARDSNQAFLNQVEGNVILDVLRGQLTPQQGADKLQQEWSSGRYTAK